MGSSPTPASTGRAGSSGCFWESCVSNRASSAFGPGVGETGTASLRLRLSAAWPGTSPAVNQVSLGTVCASLSRKRQSGMQPDLSIVIPSHCRVDLLRLCLRSVLENAPGATELMVVDDGSPGSRVTETVREFAGVACLSLRRQRGFCAAVNAGIAASRAPIVEVLNDDTEVTSGWAAAALAHFRDPRVGAVAPLVLQTSDPRRVDSAGDRYYLGG